MRAIRNIVLLIACGKLTASATVILQNLGGPGAVAGFFGESFTTPASVTWNNVTFNFYADVPATTPAAAGIAFLLTQEYLSTPNGLSSSTLGFVAESTGISTGEYIFAPSLTLQPSTMYFVYENGNMTASGGNTVSGDLAYVTSSGTGNFVTAQTQASNFLLTGSAVTSVPEPSTLGLMTLALGAVCFGVHRRFRS